MVGNFLSIPFCAFALPAVAWAMIYTVECVQQHRLNIERHFHVWGGTRLRTLACTLLAMRAEEARPPPPKRRLNAA